MSTLGLDSSHAGRCKSSLTGKHVPALKDSCKKLGLKVSTTGARGGPIKWDYVAALWVHSMDFSSFVDETQDEIRRFIAWLIAQTMPEMRHVARLYFDVEGTFTTKADLCEQILEQLLEDPELPAIPGFDSDAGDDATVRSQQVKPNKPAQGVVNKETVDANQKTVDMVQWIYDTAPADNQPHLLAAIIAANTANAANAANAADAADSSQSARTKKPNNSKHVVEKKSTINVSIT